MNLKAIKKAVMAGKDVRWTNDNYRVMLDSDTFIVKNMVNRSQINLTWRNGTTMNFNEKDFYVRRDCFLDSCGRSPDKCDKTWQCKLCNRGDVLSPYRPYEVLFECTRDYLGCCKLKQEEKKVGLCNS